MKYLLSLSLLLFSTLLLGQSSLKISGSLTDLENKPLDLVLVAILDLSDSTYVQSEYTDMDGSFEFLNITAGTYELQATLLSYETHKQMIELNKESLELNPIILKEDALQLDQVTVTATIPFIERKIDRTVLNPEALISGGGTNALELLEKAPGLSVDNNGGLMLKGRSGVSVFINDKPSYLSGSDLESYLRSLPTGTIKRIEIMTNPPAKYEAEGNAGVINIITKRNKLLGFYGNTNLGFRRGKYSNSNNSLNLNYNRNKVSVYSNIYGGFWNGLQDLFINRYYKNDTNERVSSFSQNSFGLRDGRYLNAKIGLDVYATEKSTLGISYKNANSPSGRFIDNTADVLNAENNLVQRVLADNDDHRTFKNALYNIYFTQELDSLGSKLSIDADHVNYQTGSEQVFKNFIYDSAGQLNFSDQINGDLPSEINIYAAKTDLTKTLNPSSKLEFGLKTAYTKTDNEAIYSTTIENITEPDYQLSNKFLYDEWINAAYLNFSKSFSKIELQAGLRAETTNFTGEQVGNPIQKDTSFTRSYLSLFPTFYLSSKLDTAGNSSLTFSYGRRVERPYFQDLNPFISPLDKFTFYGGNPDLLPTYSHNLALTYAYKQLSTSLNYSKTDDAVNETLEIREGIYYSRPGNIANSQSLTLSLEGSIPISKWYTLNTYMELGHLQYDSPLYSQQLNSKGTYYYLSANNGFQLGKGWKAELSGNVRSDVVVAQLVIKGYFVANCGLQKKILNDKGNIRINLSDIFYSRRGDGIINNLAMTDADWNSTFDSRLASVNFSYNFGKPTSNKQKHQSSGSEGEQRRVKS